MKIGAIVPQGWVGEYDGWDTSKAWQRTTAVARQADRLGFESIWLFDHFHTVPRPTDEITFESFTTLSALAALTSRVRLGHIVICTAFRNPALTAKMISTMDAISGGRMELGIGAGWKARRVACIRLRLSRDPRAPRPTRRRPRRDHRDVCRRQASARDIRRSVQLGAKRHQRPEADPTAASAGDGRRNEPNVTWRLAARFADELNVDGLTPDEVREALPTIRGRCEEIDRDPATLALSVHMWTELASISGQRRVDLLAGYRDAGVDRVMGLDKGARPRTRRSMHSPRTRGRQASSWPIGPPPDCPRREAASDPGRSMPG